MPDINDFIKMKEAERASNQNAAPSQVAQGVTFAEKMKAEREAAYQKTEEVYQSVWKNEEKFKQLLDIMETFGRPRDKDAMGSGPRNAALILAAMPEASYLMSRTDWEAHGCFFSKGSHSINIFHQVQSKKEPQKSYYNLVRCFDVSQVYGNQGYLAALRQEEREAIPLDILLTAITSSDDYGIEYVDNLPDGYNSAYIAATQTIVLREGPTIPQQTFSLLDELSHRQLSFQKGYERINSVNEFVAYSSAYIISRRYCLSTENVRFPKDSFPDATPDQVKDYISSIYYTSRSVIRDLDKALEKIQEQVVGQESDRDPDPEQVDLG